MLEKGVICLATGFCKIAEHAVHDTQPRKDKKICRKEKEEKGRKAAREGTSY
jgi:hypothetical protein